MMYRYQCYLRIDRQHEIEKRDAVKSMLNWLRANAGLTTIIGYTNELKFVAASGRELNVISVPTPVLFPDAAKHDIHFSIAKYGNNVPSAAFESSSLGSSYYKFANNAIAQKYGLYVDCPVDAHVPMLRRSQSYEEGPDGLPVETNLDRLYFGGMTNKGDRSALSIEMPKVGGWWNDDYGRRYEVDFETMGTNAYHRIYLMRKSTQWPLQNNEVALCLEFISGRGREEDNIMQAFYCRGRVMTPVLAKNGDVVIRQGSEKGGSDSNVRSLSSNGPKGIQLAGRYLSIYGATAGNYIFSNNIGYLDEDVYKAFTDNADGVMFDNGDLKMVVEEECRNSVSSADLSYTEINSIMVSPAYKFDIYVEYPVDPLRKFGAWSSDWKLATVAQPCMPDRANANPIVITYDTHGTENKGFRKDEREAERKRSRR